MKRPTVYLETSFISAFWYEGADVSMLARRLHTRDWWELERQHFAIWTSVATEAELRAGTFRRQKECLKVVRRVHYLTMSGEAREFQEEIMRLGIVPPNKKADAAHLALCATHEIDFLLTWNYAHMANPMVQERLKQLCSRLELRVPLMVSPESIPQVRFGQSIRREE